MKKLLFLLVGPLLLFSCTDIPTELETYSDEEYGFELGFPEGWEIEQPSDEGYIKVIFHSPSQGPLDDFAESINVGVENKGEFSFDVYMDLSLENMESLEGFKLEDVGTIEGMEYQHQYFIYLHTYESTRIKALALVIEDGNQAFIVNCSADAKTFREFEPIFFKSVGSFKLTD